MLAAFIAGELEEYDCKTCTDELQPMRGCTEDALRPLLVFEDKTELLRCPVRCVTPDLWNVARAYRYKEAGLMPASGGWMEQSATLLDAFELLDREIASYSTKNADRPMGRR
ncbi:MAG: hypothetical protein PHP88_06655 [bacterium]|nr:hypothetical protein [bacterium]